MGVVLESGLDPEFIHHKDCGCHSCAPQATQEIAAVPTVSKLPDTAYVFAIDNGVMVKILVANLKKQL